MQKHEINTESKKTRWSYKKLAISAVIVLVIISAAFAVGYYLWPKPILPSSVTKQVNFTVFVPNEKVTVVNKNSAKYDEKLKLLSYDIVANNIKIVISLQPTPESFTEIPEAYDRVVASMNEYAKFENNLGVVRLTRPTDLDGKQVAVLNAKGTLAFIKPESDLTDDEWKDFFNNLVVMD
jgi:hypothetical protein